MDFNKFVIRFNFIMNIVLLIVLVFVGFSWADTNGVWHRAEDILAGTFGSDEVNNSLYIFPNDLEVKNDLCLGAECHNSWSSVCESWVLNNSIN